MAPLVTLLFKSGLNLLASSVIAKGVKYVEEKYGGINLSTELSTEEGIQRLGQLQADRQEELLQDAIELKKMDLAVFNEETADKRDARQMQEAALQSDSWIAKNFVYLFAGVWSLFAMTYIIVITFNKIPDDSIRFADTVLGFLLGTIVASFINFFFGSSYRSGKKDETIQKLIADKGAQDEAG